MDISVLFGKEKTFNIAGQEFKLKPLELKDADIFVKMEKDVTKGKDEAKGEAIKELIAITLKKSYPDITDEDIEKISIEHLEELTKAIMEVNNFDVEQ